MVGETVAGETVAADPQVPRRGLTRREYDALVQAGVLEGERVELLDGTLVTMTPQGWPHARAIVVLTRWFSARLPEPWYLAVQVPLAAAGDSEPEPDLAVVELGDDDHPRTAAPVVEVCASTHRTDLVHKPRVYARAGVGEYWVIDLPRRDVVVHTGAGPDGYTTVSRRPWTTPLHVLGVRVDLAGLLGGR